MQGNRFTVEALDARKYFPPPTVKDVGNRVGTPVVGAGFLVSGTPQRG